MTEQERNQQTYRRLCDEVFNHGEPNKVEGVLHAGYQADDPAVSRKGGASRLEQIARVLLANTTGLRYDVEETIAERDLVAARWVISGACSGSLFGHAGDDKPFKVSGMSFSRYSEGKMVQAWILWDVHGLLRQLGALPPLGELDGKPA